MNHELFTYNKKSVIAEYNGCLFHSIVELKFALMIEDTHAYTREGLRIYYDHATLKSTQVLKTDTPYFKPDFLIRDFNTHKATLVEVKPIGFNHHELLEKRKKVYEHHIAQHNYDWDYKVVYESDIILTKEQATKLYHLRNSSHQRASFITAIQHFDRKIQQNNSLTYFNHEPNDLLGQLTREEYKFFVRRGVLPALVP